jgi:DNA replication protein DnaC
MTMTDPEREALETWHAERRERLAANLLAGRPAEFAAPGQLDQRLVAWARDLTLTRGRNLILTGPVGTGKTWAVWHAAERAVRHGYEGRVAITTAARFRRVVAPSTADPAEFSRYTDAGLLAIDDLAAARLSEWDMDHLGELVDARWADQRPTVVTSNVTDLRTLLGPRISSRLAHNAVTVEMTGPDRRRKP